MNNLIKLCTFIVVLAVLASVGQVYSPTEAKREYLQPNSETLFLPSLQITKTFRVNAITGYSSSIDETDDTPFITASGDKVRLGIAATNILPFNTKIILPEIFGKDFVIVVKDRMNSRYTDRIDIWFPTKKQAEDFGIHYNVLVEIVE
jgi:3D (Asp-Asp-Asp) domain-containing protein